MTCVCIVIVWVCVYCYCVLVSVLLFAGCVTIVIPKVITFVPYVRQVYTRRTLPEHAFACNIGDLLQVLRSGTPGVDG
jgi:hypothetical protein